MFDDEKRMLLETIFLLGLVPAFFGGIWLLSHLTFWLLVWLGQCPEPHLPHRCY